LGDLQARDERRAIRLKDMLVFEISYELRGDAPPWRYRRIAEAIQAMTGNWAHQPESLWYIYAPSSWTVGQIRQHLLPYIETGDRLTVTIPKKMAWYGVDPQVQQWLKERMAPIGLADVLATITPPIPPIPSPKSTLAPLSLHFLKSPFES